MNVRLIVPNCAGFLSPVVAYGKTIGDLAGGWTAIQAQGGWQSGKALIVEPVTVFDCHSTQTASPTWRALARRIAVERCQQCVYLEIDGEVDFVRAK